MEQTDSGECHYHAVFVAGSDYIVITDRSARLCHISHTASVRTLDVVTKREERIGTKRNVWYSCPAMRASLLR